MAETTQDTSMTISEKREAIMDLTGVSAETVMRLSPEQVGITYRKVLRDAEKSSPATRATTPPVTSRPTTKHKGGPVHKRPQMMGGGMYKGRKHAYAAGGSVKNLNIVKSK